MQIKYWKKEIDLNAQSQQDINVQESLKAIIF